METGMRPAREPKWMAVITLVMTAACSHEHHKHAPADAIPERISIGAGTVTEGTVRSTLRRSRTLGAYSITKTPVTVSQFRQCVSDGACRTPSLKAGTCATLSGIDGATYNAGVATAPITCVTVSEARAYCEWVGGRLPRPSEWLMAARGPEVHPFAWGENPPTNDRIARASFFASPASDCGDACVDRVGSRPRGESPSGLADVLVTRTELTDAEEESLIGACRPPATGCAILALSPGAIDQWLPAAESGASAEVAANAPAASFRCVWEGESR